MIYISTSCIKGETSKFNKNVIEVVKAYAELGIHNIELGAVHDPFDDFKALKDLQEKYKLNFIIHANFPAVDDNRMMNIASSDSKFRKECIEHALTALEKLKFLKGDLYTIHPGYCDDMAKEFTPVGNKKSKDEAVANALDSLKTITKRAKELGVKVAIENSTEREYSIFCTADDFMKIRKYAEVGILLDIGHMDVFIAGNDENRKKMIKQLEPYILEMHCHKSTNKDAHLLPEASIFRDFSKETLKNTKLTLEATNLSKEDILKGKNILEKVQNS